MNYLNNGGNFYFESVNIGYDYNNTEFFDYLGIEYLDDGSENEVVNLKGGCNNCSEDLKFDYLGGISPHHSVDRLDSDGSELLFSSEDGVGRVYINETDYYKIISSSVVIAAVANADSLNIKSYLFSEYINYFLGYNPITDLKENIQQFISSGNYPNPFNKQTTISFNLEISGPVKIDIYDAHGRHIKQLVNHKYTSGEYKVKWDATDMSGSRVSSGYYYYQVAGGNEVSTGKMILLE